MEKLSSNWLVEGLIDFEYKKYMLLAYLNNVSRQFNENKLYPFLSDIIFHYENLNKFRENKELVSNNFPKKLTRLDLENFKLEYEKMMDDDECLEEIQSIIDFALPKLKLQLEEGKEIYDIVEENLEISPIGIIPLNTEFGYIFIQSPPLTDTRIYQYEITIFEGADEKYRGLKTNYLTSFSRSFTTTYESMKIDLIKNFKEMPNPATFLVSSKMAFPHEETFLPVAKRSFVRYIAGIQTK